MPTLAEFVVRFRGRRHQLQSVITQETLMRRTSTIDDLGLIRVALRVAESVTGRVDLKPHYRRLADEIDAMEAEPFWLWRNASCGEGQAANCSKCGCAVAPSSMAEHEETCWT